MTCCASGLGIVGGTAVRCLLLTESPYMDGWLIRTPPIRAVYNGYGTIEDVNPEDRSISDLWMRGLQEDMVEQGPGDNSCHDLPAFKGMTFEATLETLWEGRLYVRLFWHRVPLGFEDQELSLAGTVEAAIEKSAPGSVSKQSAKGKFVIDEPVPELIRVRYGSYEAPTQLHLRRALKAVSEAGLVGVITAGSGRYPNDADLLVFRRPDASARPMGPQWDKAAGADADDDKKLRVKMAMVREDVWQALVAYPHSEGVYLDCDICSQSPFYHEEGLICPSKSVGKRKLKKHPKKSTYTHRSVFPADVEHKLIRQDYKEEVWFGLAAFRAGVRETWDAISKRLDSPSPVLEEKRKNETTYFGDFLVGTELFVDYGSMPKGASLMLESSPSVIQIREHLAMLRADKTEPSGALLDGLAELAAVRAVLRAVGVNLAPVAHDGPQYPEWREHVRFHKTIVKIAQAEQAEIEQHADADDDLNSSLHDNLADAFEALEKTK